MTAPTRLLAVAALCAGLASRAAGSLFGPADAGDSFAVAHQAAIYVISNFVEPLPRGVRVVRLAFGGEPLWQEWVGGAATGDRAEAAIVGRDGSLYLGGSSGKNSLLARLGATGHRLWSRGLDPWQENRVHRVALDDDQNLYASGTRFNGRDFDAFVVKLNSNGEQVWRFLYDNGGNEYGTGLSADLDGSNVLLVAERATGTGFTRDRVWLDRNGQRVWR